MITICTNVETLTSGYPALATPMDCRAAAEAAIAAAEEAATILEFSIDRDGDYRRWNGGTPPGRTKVGAFVDRADNGDSRAAAVATTIDEVMRLTLEDSDAAAAAAEVTD